MAGGGGGCFMIVALGVGATAAIALTNHLGVWPWIIAAVAIYAWVEFNGDRVKEENEERRRQLALAPCKHSTAGAAADPRLCSACVQERAAAERARVELERQFAEQNRQAEVRWRERLRNTEYLRQVPPLEFERIVLLVYRSMGFDAQATPRTNDEGIDGFLRRGNELVLLQCKRVQRSVGQPFVRDLLGCIKHVRSTEPPEVRVSGLLVTTGRVSQQARAWAANHPISFVEIDELVELIKANISIDRIVPGDFVAPAHAAPQGECPRCGGKLRRRSGRNGEFFGCTNYPGCRHTENSLSPVQPRPSGRRRSTR